jgi:hypothetical protein
VVVEGSERISVLVPVALDLEVVAIIDDRLYFGCVKAALSP